MSFLDRAKQTAHAGGNTIPTGAKPQMPVPGVKPTSIPKPTGTIPGKPPVPGVKPTGMPKPPAGNPPTSPLVSKGGNPFLINKTENATAPVETVKEEKKEVITPTVEEPKVEAPANLEADLVAADKAEADSKEEIKANNKAKEEEEKKEEAKVESKPETKKPKRTPSKKGGKKTEETTAAVVNTTEPVEFVIPTTEVDYAEAVIAIKSSFQDKEWEAFREDIVNRMNDIVISSDMTTSVLKATLDQLSGVRDSIWLAYSDTKNLFESLTSKEPEGIIERTKRLAAKGSNTEERKQSAVIACMNYIEPKTGAKINLFELLDETRERYNFLNNTIQAIQYKTNVLVTMLGSLKLEK